MKHTRAEKKCRKVKVHWFMVVEWSSVRKSCVFNCFLKVVMVSAVQVEAGSSFHQKGAERVKVLESDFVPNCNNEAELIHFIFKLKHK